MIYIFDSCAFIDLFRYYYRDRFPSLWSRFDKLAEDGTILSVKEVALELNDYEDVLGAWVKLNKELFHSPTTNELLFIRKIFEKKHFQILIDKKARLQGKPVADPFVIAKAKEHDACVVTSEKFKENSAKIPNICKAFDISCCNLEEFMERENWLF